MFTIFLELEVDRNVGSSVHGQWVQPERSVVVTGTWVHATSLVNIMLDKQFGHFNVANCWMRWLACRMFPYRFNNFPLHAYSSREIRNVVDFMNRLRRDELYHADPRKINLITNEEWRLRNPGAPLKVEYLDLSWAWARNVGEPGTDGKRRALC